jgi:hypothetical protein
MTTIEDSALSPDEQRRVAELLNTWTTRVRVALAAYNDATTRTIAAERRLGIPAVIIGAVVATGVFATLQKNPGLSWRIITGALALLAAVLTALQTFLRQSERTAHYREAARGYGRIRRRIELATLFPPQTKREAHALLAEISEAMDEAARGKPNLPQGIWERADYKVRYTSDARGWRALRLRMGDSLRFGIRDSPPARLPEDHRRYFSNLDTATVVAVSKLHPRTAAAAQPDSVARARQRMQEAASGIRPRRNPLDVVEAPGGNYVIVDGNATFAVAEEEGWNSVPVRSMDSAGSRSEQDVKRDADENGARSE